MNAYHFYHHNSNLMNIVSNPASTRISAPPADLLNPPREKTPPRISICLEKGTLNSIWYNNDTFLNLFHSIHFSIKGVVKKVDEICYYSESSSEHDFFYFLISKRKTDTELLVLVDSTTIKNWNNFLNDWYRYKERFHAINNVQVTLVVLDADGSLGLGLVDHSYELDEEDGLVELYPDI